MPSRRLTNKEHTTMNEEHETTQEITPPEGWTWTDNENWARTLIDADGVTKVVRVTRYGRLLVSGFTVFAADSAAHAFRVAEAMIEGRVKWLDPNDPAHMTEDQLRAEVIRLRAEMPQAGDSFSA